MIAGRLLLVGLVLLTSCGAAAEDEPAPGPRCRPVMEPPQPPKVPRKPGELYAYALRLTAALDYANQSLSECAIKLEQANRKAE